MNVNSSAAMALMEIAGFDAGKPKKAMVAFDDS